MLRDFDEAVVPLFALAVEGVFAVAVCDDPLDECVPRVVSPLRVSLVFEAV